MLGVVWHCAVLCASLDLLVRVARGKIMYINATGGCGFALSDLNDEAHGLIYTLSHQAGRLMVETCYASKVMRISCVGMEITYGVLDMWSGFAIYGRKLLRKDGRR